jgi:RNA polymerase sigma-70 factor, ECF subfamily
VTLDEKLLKHRDELLSCARRQTFFNTHDAEDALHDAYLKAIESDRLGKYRPDDAGGHTRAWLYRILENTVRTHQSRRKRIRHTPFDETVELVDVDERRPATDSEELSPEVRAAIDALPDEQYEVLVEYELRGQSYKQIAAFLDVPIGTVMSRLNRARGRLREALGPYYVDRYGTG